MRVRRGFDRLCVVGYFLWLVLLTLGALWETSESRARYKREEQSLSDEITPREAFGQEELDVVQHPTLGTLKFPKSMPFDERNRLIDELVRRQAQREKLVRLRDKTTFLVTVRSHFASWTGWVLAVFLPGGVYLSLLATGYTARWVYRGFSHGPR